MDKNIEAIMKGFAEDPEGSALKLEQAAQRAAALAKMLRKLQAFSRGISRGGIADRVQMDLVAPDGTVKQHVDTARR